MKQIEITHEDGSSTVINDVYGFTLTVLQPTGDPPTEDGRPVLGSTYYQHPPGTWLALESLRIQATRLEDSKGTIRAVGMAVNKTLDKGNQLLAAANEELGARIANKPV
jgi:hypothetical protein